MEHLIEKFRQFIKQKGLKYTPEREEILREILSLEDHFDVESLYLQLKKKNSKISKASIYRTLPLLVEGGYIQEVYKQGGHSHYEVTLNKQPHLHFICIQCGEVKEALDHRLNNLIEEFERQSKYRFLTYHLEIFGLCPNCREV
ncbi:MAG: transcriptional repressor [Caldimicrobium sp.]|nr:transcriptional repressor [Caldimicrobium sp.]MCX7872981.1 transcriptional repressor [Caldimicrobium sp.]MDW8094600.1 transcriptional repressor [Caldimicrobium sp.]